MNHKWGMREMHTEHWSAYLIDSIQVGDASMYGEYSKTDNRETTHILGLVGRVQNYL